MGTATNFRQPPWSLPHPRSEIGGCPHFRAQLDRRSAGLCALAAALAPTAGLAQSRKPRVPNGRDPGGIAVAIADVVGIDYTASQIAARLARDGEGDLIGWDFVDGDLRPYAAPGTASFAPLAGIVLAEAPAARLIPFRARLETIALGRLMVFTGKGPAKVLLLLAASDKREEWAAFAEAAAHFKHVLVIAPVAAGLPPFPGGLSLETLLTVAEATPTGAHPGDLAVPGASGAPVAAARIAALAARLLAVEPQLAGAALKARIKNGDGHHFLVRP